jgi:hypothetical protein
MRDTDLGIIHTDFKVEGKRNSLSGISKNKHFPSISAYVLFVQCCVKKLCSVKEGWVISFSSLWEL